MNGDAQYMTGGNDLSYAVQAKKTKVAINFERI